MKNVTVWDLWTIAVFIVAMFGKCSAGWIIVPYIVSIFWSIWEASKIDERIKGKILMFFIKRKVEAAGKKARQQFGTSNPGSFINKDINPKQRF